MRKLDRQKLVWQFQITAEGGAIQIDAKEPGDLQTREAVQTYGQALGEKLNKGDFELLFALMPPNPPFVEGFKQKGGISFLVELRPAGLRLNIGASSLESRIRVHDFIRAEGGEATVRVGGRKAEHPGNNLGWDAPPAPDLTK